MVLGWRTAFCTNIRRDEDNQDHTNSSQSPSPSPSPSTSTITLRCRTPPPSSSSTDTVQPLQSQGESPSLQCKTTRNSPGFFNFSHPSSPKSPSTFSFLKSSLGISKLRCSICLETMKSGQGTAIFTAECGHAFHFPCVAVQVKKTAAVSCSVCNSPRKEMTFLSLHNVTNDESNFLGAPKVSEPACPCPSWDERKLRLHQKPGPILKMYNDDEPLNSPTGVRFHTIPESNEENEGVCDNSENNSLSNNLNKGIEVNLLHDVAVISRGKSTETHAMVMKLKAPTIMGNMVRAPIDLVMVLDVSSQMNYEKLQIMNEAMGIVLSLLSGIDRLSIVAFSTASKRLLPLRRMTAAGHRVARRIVEGVVVVDGGASSSRDAVMKAVKVLEDRRQKNAATCIILLSGGEVDQASRFSHLAIPVHAIPLGHSSGACNRVPYIRNILSVVAQDVSIRLGLMSGSSPAEIVGVYASLDRARDLGCGLIRIGGLYAEEERELFVELKVPSSSSAIRARRLLAIRCSYKDTSTQELISCKDQALLVPHPHTVRSNVPSIQRLRSMFITTRALAESSRLIERGELGGAHHMLASTRVMLLQSRSILGYDSNDEFVCKLEVGLTELSKWKPSQQKDVSRHGLNVERDLGNEKVEPLTPTSAWRAAEKLARLAVMRKSMNRVSDLYGFENAGF